MRNVVLVSAARTPGGSFWGALQNQSAVDLGAVAIKEAVKREGIDWHMVGQVIMGNGWQAGVGPNTARLCTIKSGLSDETPAFTINIRCGSGLRAAQLGVLSIAAGETDVVVAGGTESASNTPYISTTTRFGARIGDAVLYDVLQKDGFMCPLAGMLMGSTAEVLAEEKKISREEQDAFALDSHKKAVAALEAGAFSDEIVPVEITGKKGVTIFNMDEIPKSDTTFEKLGNLKPVFKKGGTVTAGNSSALCDGAAVVVLMAEEKARDLGAKPMARILSYSFVGIEPKYMGLAPVKAIPDALKKANLTMNDIDLFEINEAFAVQVIACDKELHIDPSKLNVHGGAIALGHPVGATGAKLLTTLAYALKRHNKTYGLVSLCIGGGQGVTMIIENI